MSREKSQIKTRLHKRNRNRERYDLAALVNVHSELKEHVKPNKRGDDSIDFSDPKAVKHLNKALLNHYYGIENWDFPDENLCPPIPGRADYIHYMADLLSESNFGTIPKAENNVTCLDIGVGASCIYPILGVVEYGWNFIGSDIDAASIESANNIVQSNKALENKIDCRLQKSDKAYFKNVISEEDRIDLSICNPPFHSSEQEAKQANQRKVDNLSGKSTNPIVLNFAGVKKELICEGGEFRFIQDMILESKDYSKSCFWFSSLVSREKHLKALYKVLRSVNALHVRTISMSTANKSSRILAWTFLSKAEQKVWSDRWKSASKD